ncbi:alpha/beta hydrolase [Streptomyces sp. NPDC050560]|uniref:alpha/beta hydrolase n=1 Tax=Streptomyces sp. NPDC050560 TaxID=3365630 RepID=UPI0037AB832B
MDHVAELKEFARLHARGQGLSAARTDRVLGRIHNDTPGDPASWAAVWNVEGDASAAAGRLLDAVKYYALARFPHPGDDDRRRAQDEGVAAFDRWRRSRPDGRKGAIERLELRHPEGTLAAWAAGLDAPKPRPLLIVMGGIVSVKEQWAPLLPLLERLGFAAVVSELPGVGENTLLYGPRSWRLMPFLMDRLAGRARVSDTSLLALSFSGHLALRAAVEDTRVRRVLTVGAPVRDFFADGGWWPRVPGITRETLRRLTGMQDEAALRGLLPRFALTDEQIRRIRVPVRYVASARDEIIPAREQELLGRAPGDVRFKVFDDVHGSPAHLGPMRLYLFSHLLRLRVSDRGRGPAYGAGVPVGAGH